MIDVFHVEPRKRPVDAGRLAFKAPSAVTHPYVVQMLMCTRIKRRRWNPPHYFGFSCS